MRKFSYLELVFPQHYFRSMRIALQKYQIHSQTFHCWENFHQSNDDMNKERQMELESIMHRQLRVKIKYRWQILNSQEGFCFFHCDATWWYIDSRTVYINIMKPRWYFSEPHFFYFTWRCRAIQLYFTNWSFIIKYINLHTKSRIHIII